MRLIIVDNPWLITLRYSKLVTHGSIKTITFSSELPVYFPSF